MADLKAGNERFVAGKLTPRDYMGQAKATAAGGQTIADLLAQSEVISDLVEAGDLVVGGVYDLATGRVNWLDS